MGPRELPDHQYVISLLLVAPAFGLGWLCGWLWANRLPVRAQPQPDELPEELIQRLADVGAAQDGAGSVVDERAT